MDQSNKGWRVIPKNIPYPYTSVEDYQENWKKVLEEFKQQVVIKKTDDTDKSDTTRLG